MIRTALIFAVIISCSKILAQVYQMDNVNGMTINTCSGTFYDSDALDLVPGSGDLYYDINENYQVTFCSSTPGDAIRFDFSFIQAVAGEDTLWVYDGTNTASTPIGIYSGGYGSQSVIGYSGCLTFVFQSTGAFVSIGWEASISCFNVPPTPLQPSCTNVGFESGNFNGWYGTYGTPTSVIPATGPTAMSTGAPGSLHPNYFPDVYGVTTTPYHTITSGAGTDLYGGFPVVSPSGGTNSMMLGDFDNPYYGGSSIEQKFNVTAANAVMIYSYAVVIQNAFDAQGNPHLPTEQPYFQIEAFDCNGNSILCGDYLVVGGPNIPGFTLSPLGADVYYKPWTDVFLDLTPFIGSCVTVKFTQGDCTLGAHFSYVYLDAVCTPLEITGPQYICPGEFATLVAPSGGASYLWSPGGEITPTITVSPSSLTNYSCTVTSVVGPTCVSTAYYWVDVYPPASVVSDSQTVCAGSSATLTATPNSTGGTFVWSPGGAITPSITVAPSATTNYTVTFTDANGCIADSIGVVTVIPAPIVTPVPDETVCHNDATSAVTFTSATSGTTFAWTNNNTLIGLGASGNGNIASFTATNPGTATITATVTVTPTANGCVGLPISYTITVNPTPNVNPILDQTICSGSSTTALNFSGSVFGTTYGWANSNTSIGLTASGTGDIASFTGINSGPGSISGTVTVTPTSNGCVGAPTSAVITVNPLPTAIITGTVTICEGSNALITFAGFNGTAPYTFTYNINNGSTLTAGGVGSTVNIIIPSPAVGTYIYNLVGVADGSTPSCSQPQSGTITITVNPNPVPVITGTLVYCQGTYTTLSTINVYSSYLWSTGAITPTADVTIADNPITVQVTNAQGCIGTSTAVNVMENTNLIFSFALDICQGDSVLIHGNYESVSGSYTNTYVLPNGCDSMVNVNLVVNPLPMVNAGPDIIVCDGDQIALTASGANTYVWDNNVTNGIPFNPASGLYTVIGTDINGCIGTDDLLVTVEPLPIPDFIVDVPLCEPFTVTLTNTTQGNISECVWTISNGAVLTGCGPIVYTFDNSGSYDVTLTTTSTSGCVGSITYTDIIYLEDGPVASFNPGSSELSNFNTQIQFNNTSTGATNYFWTFGDQSPYSTEVNPLHSFPDDVSGSVSYLVTLIAYSANGCPDTAYALITVNQELIFYVPNTFTPDNDDFNETFKPVFTAGFDPFDYTLLIFNRWGEIVFESHDTEVGWDATYANKYEAQDGTYTWKIDFKTSLTDERIMVHGHVNVLK